MRASGNYADLTNPEYSKPFWSLSESEQVTPDDLPGSNAAAHGISGVGDKKDMAIDSVSVNSGELIFNSEVAINTVTLDGGQPEAHGVRRRQGFYNQRGLAHIRRDD